MRRILAALVLSATACGPSAVPVPDADHARSSGLPIDELRRGRALYLVRCAGCHTLYPVAAKAPGAWNEVVAKMALPAKLQPDESAAIAHYLQAVAR